MQKWVSNDFSEIFNSSPAIGADGTIYFGSTVPSYAVNPDGTLKWETTSGGNGYSSPAIGADGTVYFGTDDGLIAINTYVIGTCGTPPYTYACPLLKWAFKTAGAVPSSPAIGANGIIYVGDSSGNLYSLTDGGQGIVTQNWAFTIGGPILSSPAFGTAAGTIYVGSDDGNLYAIVDDGSDAVEKWTFATGSPVFTTPAIGPDGTIYFGSETARTATYTRYPTNCAFPAQASSTRAARRSGHSQPAMPIPRGWTLRRRSAPMGPFTSAPLTATSTRLTPMAH